MRDGRAALRVAVVIASGVAVVSIVGVIAMVAVNAFVLDKFNAYGEVPIPGSRPSTFLPAM